MTPNQSHGHVTPNADGSLARCGGPKICKVCLAELAQLRAKSAPAEPYAELVRQCIAQELATWEGDLKGPVHTAMRCLQVRIDAKLASLVPKESV